jgi:GNAT superfamily N-acetyltransferase
MVTRESKPRIREFRTGDVLPLKALIHKTIGVCYPGRYCVEAVRFFLGYHDERAILRDAREGCTIILDRAGRTIGTGTLVAGEIKRVFVDPASQKQGFGRLIMQNLEEKAVSSGLKNVRLDASLPSRAFYDRVGYTTVREAFLEVENGRRLEFFKMERTLSVPAT